MYYAVADSGKQVALKYLRDNPEIELRGISHVMNLKSPHLITIYDVRHNAAGEPFVIMEYVSGPSLWEVMLAEPNGLGPQKAAFFIDGVAKGLAYLHERGIVHRDLKPANIFYDDGYVKIGDYGLSKHMSVSKHSGQTVSVGTVHYMAPEIGSGSYTRAIDVYALGVILFELLTGKLPFTGSSMGEILMRHLSDRPDLSGIPEPFAGVISKALAKDPNDRYQDANEMADALREFSDVSASIASFDPSSLTAVPRVAEAADAEQTVTTPPRVPPPPPLDAGAPAAPPDFPDRMVEKLQQKVDKFARKLEKKADKLRQKGRAWTRREAGPAVPGAPAVPGRKGQIFVLLAVTVAVAIGLSLLGGGGGDQAVALAFCIAAGTFGPLLTYFRFLVRSPARSPMWDTLTYLAITAMFMIPSFAIASEMQSDFAGVMAAPLAVLLLCNWTKRIEAGRRGTVSGGAAFWPAVIGLIAANIVNAEEYGLVAACVCATMSLMTQAGASVWPLPRHAPASPRGGGPGRGHRQAGRHALLGKPGFHRRGEGQTPTARSAADDMWQAQPARPGSGAARPTVRIPRSPILRSFYGVAGTLVLAGSLGAFFALVIVQPSDDDACAGLLFATLAGVAWLPFLLSKVLHRYKMPVWRGTLRMLVVSLGLCLAAGMISLISFQDLCTDELGGAIFGLVAGGVIALVVLCVPGRKWRSVPLPYVPEQAGRRREPTQDSIADEAQAETPESVSPAAEEFDAAAPAPTMVVIDAAAPSFVGRTVNAGASFFGKLLLVLGLVLALGQDVVQRRVGEIMPRGVSSSLISEDLPEPLLLGIVALGCMFLLLARRGSGGPHMLRGCLGCTLVLCVAVGVLGPAAEDWSVLFEGKNWSELDWDKIAPTLVLTTLALAAALVLLSWPRRSQEKTIVI